MDSLIEQADQALREQGAIVWILLDRLDVAFLENVDLERNALRALFRVYRDMMSHANIRPKIFLRTDIWNRITREGFREASHITRTLTIEWDRTSLLNLVVRRCVGNVAMQSYFSISSANALKSIEEQEKFFYRIFPEQVEVGPNKSNTLEWILGRTKDGTGRNAPRELVHFLAALRDAQVHNFEIGEAMPEGEQLFSRTVFKQALEPVSKVRLEQTIYAEYPWHRDSIEALRGEKTRQSPESLSELWAISLDQARTKAQELVDIGFFSLQGTRENPEYWVPFLYRDALSMVQGTA